MKKPPLNRTTAFLFENFSSTLYNRPVTAVTPAPANGKEVIGVEFLMWLLKTVAEAAIWHSVGKVLDYIFKRL